MPLVDEEKKANSSKFPRIRRVCMAPPRGIFLPTPSFYWRSSTCSRGSWKAAKQEKTQTEEQGWKEVWKQAKRPLGRQSQRTSLWDVRFPKTFLKPQTQIRWMKRATCTFKMVQQSAFVERKASELRQRGALPRLQARAEYTPLIYSERGQERLVFVPSGGFWKMWFSVINPVFVQWPSSHFWHYTIFTLSVSWRKWLAFYVSLIYREYFKRLQKEHWKPLCLMFVDIGLTSEDQVCKQRIPSWAEGRDWLTYHWLTGKLSDSSNSSHQWFLLAHTRSTSASKKTPNGPAQCSPNALLGFDAGVQCLCGLRLCPDPGGSTW